MRQREPGVTSEGFSGRTLGSAIPRRDSVEQNGQNCQAEKVRILSFSQNASMACIVHSAQVTKETCAHSFGLRETHNRVDELDEPNRRLFLECLPWRIMPAMRTGI